MSALPAIVLSSGHDQASGTCGPLLSELRRAAAGLYLPSREVAHTGHELTQKILRSKDSAEHDPLLARLLAVTARRHFPDFTPELVVSMPPTPGRDDRFRNIRREVARHTGAADAGPALRQTRFVADYRRMSAAQRKTAADGRCHANDSVRGKYVLLIDDVVTTGSQASDAVRALAAAGAADVRFACVARTIGPGDARARRRITIRALCE